MSYMTPHYPDINFAGCIKKKITPTFFVARNPAPSWNRFSYDHHNHNYKYNHQCCQQVPLLSRRER